MSKVAGSRSSRAVSSHARAALVTLGAAALLAAGLAAGNSPAVADDPPAGPCGATGTLSGSGPFTCTYSSIGADRFTVPSGVTQASLTVVGAKGGTYFIAGDADHPGGDITGRGGGGGGQAVATLSLTPGQVLQVDVAGRGANGTAASRSGGMMNGPSGGAGAIGGFGGSNGGVIGAPGDASGANGGTAFNGGNGSGGGGASDVRSDAAGCAALTCGLGARVIVGAGGGGDGGIGGQGNAIGGSGGAGGGASGLPGGTAVDGGNAGVSGAGGTPTAGGIAGLNPGVHGPGAIPTDPRYGGDGLDGAAGAGGHGGAGNLPCTGTQIPACSGGQNETTSGGGAGGGAGGGLFGGGGGSGGGGLGGGGGGAGGGAGGGSSYVSPAAANAALTPGVNSGQINGGDGLVTITWTATELASPGLTAVASPQAGNGEITDSATLSGGNAPTGTISFKLYGPGDTTCTTALASLTATVTGAGTYVSPPFTPRTSGTFMWVASYSGDAHNSAVGGSCGTAGQSVVATGVPVPVVPSGRSVYTANQSNGTVAQFTVMTDGTLVAKTPVTLPSGATPLDVKVSPDGRSVYVANFASGSIAQFSTAPDGALTPKTPATVATGQGAGNLTISADGRTVYTTSAIDLRISLYDVAPDGTLSPKQPASISAGGLAPTTLALSPDGKSAYLSHDSGSDHYVSQFDVAADGSLTPKTPATVDAGADAHDIALSPDGTHAYVLDTASRVVWQYGVGAGGRLAPLSPVNIDTGNQPFKIVISNDGKAAYVANRQAGSMSQYFIAADGTLSHATPATVSVQTNPTGAAIGPDGSVYVANFRTASISQFSPLADGTLAAKTPANVALPTGTGPSGIAAGPLRAARAAPGAITGAAAAIAGSSATLAGSVNPDDADTGYVFEYGTTLAFGSITTPDDAGAGNAAVPVSGALSGLAPATTYYYRVVATNSVGTTLGAVRSFRTLGAAHAPVVSTGGASSVGDTSASVAGQVNPSGQATVFTFEYGPTLSFGSISPVVALDDADALEPVSATLTGLAPSTTYFYRVIASSSAGTTLGVVRAFTTTGPVTAPAATTGAASAIGATSATLAGTVDPHGSPTTFTFEYGPSNAFGSITAVDSTGTTGGPQSVALPVTGLAPNTQVRYRIVATNAAGTTTGAVQSFTTAAAVG